MCESLARALRSWVSASHRSNSAGVQVRWGSAARSTRLTCGRVSRGIFPPPVLLTGQQEGAGEQGEGDVVGPAGPSAHLVLVQAGLTFGRLELRFDGPAGGRDPGQGEQRGVRGRIGKIRAPFAAVQVAPQQQPTGATGQAVAAFPHPQGHKLVGARPLGVLAV